MSSLHMHLSKGSDSLNLSIKGSVAPVKRPPHSFLPPPPGSAPLAWGACSARLSLAAAG